MEEGEGDDGGGKERKGVGHGGYCSILYSVPINVCVHVHVSVCVCVRVHQSMLYVATEPHLQDCVNMIL